MRVVSNSAVQVLSVTTAIVSGSVLGRTDVAILQQTESHLLYQLLFIITICFGSFILINFVATRAIRKML